MSIVSFLPIPNLSLFFLQNSLFTDINEGSPSNCRSHPFIRPIFYLPQALRQIVAKLLCCLNGFMLLNPHHNLHSPSDFSGCPSFINLFFTTATGRFTPAIRSVLLSGIIMTSTTNSTSSSTSSLKCLFSPAKCP